MSKKHRGLRAILALVFAGLLGMSMIACEEDEGLGENMEDAAEEMGEGVEDAVD